jgi:hypothetical protein
VLVLVLVLVVLSLQPCGNVHGWTKVQGPGDDSLPMPALQPTRAPSREFQPRLVTTTSFTLHDWPCYPNLWDLFQHGNTGWVICYECGLLLAFPKHVRNESLLTELASLDHHPVALGRVQQVFDKNKSLFMEDTN